MDSIFEGVFKKYTNIKSMVLKDGKNYFNIFLNKGESLTQKGKIQIEIEKLKWELKDKYLDLGKHIATQNLEKKMSDFTYDDHFISKMDEIYKLNLFIKERYSLKNEI
tara:strand:- start:507 stop:830 length:324 start_codon:yes stop_codon:yes gene_type:complete